MNREWRPHVEADPFFVLAMGVAAMIVSSVALALLGIPASGASIMGIIIGIVVALIYSRWP